MPAATTTTRFAQPVVLATFLVLSALGAWFMRISLVVNDAPVGFNKAVETGLLPNGFEFKKTYTGIGPVDAALSLLVAAFLYGPARWNEAFYWQQLHFINQISPIIAIMTVEACRERNSNTWFKYTAVVAFLYQNIGGAVIIPIWMFLFHKHSAKSTYFNSGRMVPLPYAKVMLPSIFLIYCVPSFLLYVPGIDLDARQNILAFWQATPSLVNIPLWFMSPFVSTSKSSNKTADLPYLRSLYFVTFSVASAAHLLTMYTLATSTNPELTFSNVFLPNMDKWLSTIDSGLLHIFQVDWIVCAATVLIPCVLAVLDVQRLTGEGTLVGALIKGHIAVIVLTVLTGPGAAAVATWAWREGKLAEIEARAKPGKKRL